jgi:sugar phosphate isomerase/epimerase
MNNLSRRKFITTSALLGAAGALSSFSGETFASKQKTNNILGTNKSKITLGIAFGEPGKPAEQLAPGFDYVEIPIEIVMLPLSTKAEWEKTKQKIGAWNLPPVKCGTHFMGGIPFTGPHADLELALFWSKRTFERMEQLGCSVVGVWGQTFNVPEGFSKTKAMDQSLRFLDTAAELAKPHGVILALEPGGGKNSLIPLYRDGIELCKRVDRPEIKALADSGFFMELGQPLEDIRIAPELCIHNHISGIERVQSSPEIREFHKKHFRILRNMGYVGGVSAEMKFINTKGDDSPPDYRYETEKVLKYMQGIRDEVFAE